jgi:hypothetical protein
MYRRSFYGAVRQKLLLTRLARDSPHHHSGFFIKMTASALLIRTVEAGSLTLFMYDSVHRIVRFGIASKGITTREAMLP